MQGRVLIIAGSDSGGGAGIQVDIKTVTALGGYAATALTALTAQNTTGVHGIHDVPAEFVARQIECVLADIGADCIKIGMLHSPDVINAVNDALGDLAGDIPIVLDPVMTAKGGAALLQDTAAACLMDRLVPMASLLTPNTPEAEILSGLAIEGLEDTKAAGHALLALGAKNVLMKGAHVPGAEITDILITGAGEIIELGAPRIDTKHTHGTGCTLASAVAAGLAQGLELEAAVRRAHGYVQEAIRTAPGFGAGHGPLNHAHTFES